MEITQGDVVLCEFYFSDMKQTKNRPVLVFKDNLPFDDFVAIPISSKVNKLTSDELIDSSMFASGSLPVKSKIMIRKTFIVAKSVVLKKYGNLKNEKFVEFHNEFCKYFGCLR